MKKKKWLIVLAVMAIVLVLVIGIPLIINKLYKMGPGFVTVWDGADMLSYYGTLLGACGAVIGVYWSIHAAQRNYREDVRARVLPFIAVIPLERSGRINLVESFNNASSGKYNEKSNTSFYEERRLDKLYFVIESTGIKVKDKLKKWQQFLVFFSKGENNQEWQSIDLVGKQERVRKGETPCPPLNGLEKKK